MRGKPAPAHGGGDSVPPETPFFSEEPPLEHPADKENEDLRAEIARLKARLAALEDVLMARLARQNR